MLCLSGFEQYTRWVPLTEMWNFREKGKRLIRDSRFIFARVSGMRLNVSYNSKVNRQKRLLFTVKMQINIYPDKVLRYFKSHHFKRIS